MLPAIENFSKLDRLALRAFRARIEEVGLTLDAVAEAQEPFASLHGVLRERVKNHHLRKRTDDVARWIRLFMFCDVLEAAEAAAAVGPLFTPLMDAGILRKGARDGTIECPFVLGMFNRTLVFSDQLVGENGVMGFGATTITLARASFPTKQVRTALDVGCGAGTVALVLAPSATRVVGTDIDPRAVEMSRFNARLNEISNAEFRVGDLLAPVAGEQFDIVVSQPPFLAMPEGTEAKMLTHGGRRGDEIALRLIHDLPKVLAKGGVAILRVDWLAVAPPEAAPGAEPQAAASAAARGTTRTAAALVEERVRAHLGPEHDLTIVTQAPVSLDHYASLYAAAAHPLLDRGFEADFAQRRDHFDRIGGRGVFPSMTIIHRSGVTPAATSTRLTGTDSGFNPENVRALLDARALARDDKKLLAAKLRVPKGTVFAEEQLGPGSEVESKLQARFAPSALAANIELDARLLFVLTAIHEEPNVKAAIERYAAETETDAAEAMETLLPIIRDAVLNGFVSTVD